MIRKYIGSALVLLSLLLAMASLAQSNEEAPAADMPAVGTRNPNTLDEVIISQGFDEVPPGSLPGGWMQVSLDSGTTPVFYNHVSEWQVFSRTGFPTYHGCCVLAEGYNSSGGQNNDWLILPQQNLLGTITLSYYVSSQDAQNPDSYEIRVSTGGSLPADFTHLVQTVTDTPRPWTLRSHDLSEFAGAPFYIAFHYFTAAGYALKIDNLLLEGTSADAVDAAGNELPAEFSFIGNYPNPFNALTEFVFALPQASRIQLVLFNILGQESRVLADGFVGAGEHRITFDGSNLNSGIYFARLSTSKESQTRKIVLLK